MGDGEQLGGAVSRQLLPVLQPVHPEPVCLLQRPQLQLDGPLVEASIVRLTFKGLLVMA